MQSDPSKTGIENVYPPNNPPPPYSQYAPQPSAYQPSGIPYQGQTPIYQQYGTGVAPVYVPGLNRVISTPMTPSLKAYFAISGILYLIWGVLDIGLEVGIIMNSYTTYYRGLWAGGYLIGGGIVMLIASSRISYLMISLIRIFSVAIFFIILGLILSIVSLAISDRCDSYYWIYYCDNQLAFNLKITILVVFILSFIHTIINIVMARNAQKRAILTNA